MVASDILGPAKSFRHPIIGHVGLNRAGLHVLRMTASSCCASWRRRLLRRTYEDFDGWRVHIKKFRKDGVVAIPNFLGPQQFELLMTEVRGLVSAFTTAHPIPTNETRGFGKPIEYAEGFDRFDGGTLNRFIEINKASAPVAHRILHRPSTRALMSIARTERNLKQNFYIYQMLQELDPGNRDPQKDFHRDTFHWAAKFWYFLEDVEAHQGPFEYVVGSHRLTPTRLGWEYRRSVDSAKQKTPGGAFRVTSDELKKLGLPEPKVFTVPANTLVIADVRGFHRRGDAEVGTERLSLYGSLRPRPFTLQPTPGSLWKVKA